MYLSQVRIQNFRGIKDMVIPLDEDVTVLLGENNGGKTSVIDALRLLLMPQVGGDGLRVYEDDFHNGCTDESIVVEGVFDDLSEKEMVPMHEALYPDIARDGEFRFILKAKLTYSAQFVAQSSRVRSRIVGGPGDSGMGVADVMDYIDVTYLKPLRDPISGLKPSRHSCIFKHAKQCVPDDSKGVMVGSLNEMRSRMIDNFADMQKEYNCTLQKMVGKIMAQEIQLELLPSSFEDLIASLRTIVDKKDWAINGLGYNNLLYMALIMAQHADNENSYNIILVEEPEAHIHPILLRSFLNYVRKLCAERNCQVVITTHSPVLASKADLKSIRHLSIDKALGRIARSLAFVEGRNPDCFVLDNVRRWKLERYLDATRGELFFSKRILLVEGIAEQLLVPFIADKLKMNLDENNITVINCEGLNFDVFIPVLDSLNIRSVVLTDTDKYDEAEVSQYLSIWETRLASHRCITLSKTLKTFEYSLLMKRKFFEAACSVVNEIYPSGCVLQELKGELNLPSDAGFVPSDVFTPGVGTILYSLLFEKRRTGKGEFAQLLLQKIDSCNSENEHTDSWTESDFPVNVVEAIRFLCEREGLDDE